MSYYVTDPLKNYSFIITKGKVNTASPSNQTAGTTSAEQSSANQPALEPSSETVYNMGQAVDRVVDQAEAMAKRTQKLSKDILHTWQDGKVLGTWLNDTKYKETMFILKDRVTKMVDVAMGKYDDNKKKKRDDDNGNDEPPPSSPPQ
ncbi:hypothetical protein DM01DRAFT_1333629 [Hesseltinella vesiculosa]|uniref:Uncharacterized protein n=1 Tax=Hesseltinella vesiculosa TaxID=101127 RepID=A0A1X2GQP8_9FUNG|nr:hypothetical protein DM01DRAFT_1333629 [Hesseltinella vesiculosa]